MRVPAHTSPLVLGSHGPQHPGPPAPWDLSRPHSCPPRPTPLVTSRLSAHYTPSVPITSSTSSIPPGLRVSCPLPAPPSLPGCPGGALGKSPPPDTLPSSPAPSGPSLCPSRVTPPFCPLSLPWLPPETALPAPLPRNSAPDPAAQHLWPQALPLFHSRPITPSSGPSSEGRSNASLAPQPQASLPRLHPCCTAQVSTHLCCLWRDASSLPRI